MGVGFGENFVELGVAAEAGSVGGFGEVAAGGTVLAVVGPEAGKAEGVAVAGEGDADLAGEGATEIGLADVAEAGEMGEVVFFFVLAEEFEGVADGGVEGDGVVGGEAVLLEAPALEEEVMEAGVEAIGVGVLEGEIGGDTEAGFAVQEVGVERAGHESIHGLADEVEGLGLEDGVEDAVAGGALAAEIGVELALAGAPDELGFEDGDVVLRVVGTVDELVFLGGEHPEEGAWVEGEAASAGDVGDGAADDEVEFEFDVVVAVEAGRMPDGFGEEEEAVVAGAELEVFQHVDKI